MGRATGAVFGELSHVGMSGSWLMIFVDFFNSQGQYEQVDANVAANLHDAKDLLISEIPQTEGNILKAAIIPLLQRPIAFSVKVFESGEQVLYCYYRENYETTT